MLIAVLPAAAAIGDSFQYEGFSFRVIGEANNGEPGKVTVVGHSISGDITIPTQVPYSSDVYYVTEIDGYAFIRDNSITSVTLPNTVTKIGYAAFYNCASLKTVEFGTNLISIGDDAFYFCTSLSSLTFPSTLTSIGDRSFWGCSSLKSIDIPNSVTEVKTHAFTACSSLESVTISDRSVDNSMGTMIRGEMFMGCTSLKSLTINAKTILDENAIACGSLAILNINAETTIGKNAFAGCSFTSLTLPDYVTEIDEAAFSNCQLLMSANRCHLWKLAIMSPVSMSLLSRIVTNWKKSILITLILRLFPAATMRSARKLPAMRHCMCQTAAETSMQQPRAGKNSSTLWK